MNAKVMPNAFLARTAFVMLLLGMLPRALAIQNPPQPPPIKETEKLTFKPEIKLDHLLEFRDGSALHGTFDALEPGHLRWLHPDANADLSFPLESISQLVVREPKTASSGKNDEFRATLKLANGDWLFGQLTKLKDGEITLKINPKRTITVPMDRVDWMDFSCQTAASFIPASSSLEDWGAQGIWTEENGIFVARENGYLQKQLSSVSGLIDLRFSMEPSDVQRNFMFNMDFSGRDEKGNYQRSYTQVRFNEGQLYINVSSGNQNHNWNINVPLRSLRPAADGKMHYRTLLDMTGRGSISVGVNNKILATKEVKPMSGRSFTGNLTLQPMRWSEGSVWKLWDISLEPWDGVLPDPSAAPAGTHRLSRREAEPLVGTVEEMRGVTFRVKTDNGMELVPRHEVTMLRLLNAKPQAQEGLAVGLYEGGLLHMKQATLVDGKLEGQCITGQVETLSFSEIANIRFGKPVVKAAIQEKPLEDQLIFQNGDAIPGNLLTVSENDGITWKYGQDTQVAFSTARVAGVLLKQRQTTAPKPEPHQLVLRTRSGDWLPGRLNKIDAETVQFTGPHQLTMELPRADVANLFFGANQNLLSVVEGGMSPDLWWKCTSSPDGSSSVSFSFSSSSKGKLAAATQIYLDGSYVLSGRKGHKGSQIGREVPGMPEQVELSFDAACMNQSPALSLQMFYHPGGNAGLQMQLWSGGLYLYDLSPRNEGRFFGANPIQANFDRLKNSSGYRRNVRVLADRVKRHISIFIDGTRVLQYKGKDAADPWGNAVQIQTNNSSVDTIISNLWVGPWSSSKAMEATSSREDKVLLANGDEITSRVSQSQENGLYVEFEGEPLLLAYDRLRMVAFGDPSAPTEPETTPGDKPDKAAKEATAPQPAGRRGVVPSPAAEKPLSHEGFFTLSKIRLRLREGGVIAAENISFDQGHVKFSTPYQKSLTLPLELLSEIIWHPLASISSKSKSGTKKFSTFQRPIRRKKAQ